MTDGAPEIFSEGKRRSEPQSRRRRHAAHPLEWAATVHLSIFVVAATWAFGGQAAWVRGPLTAWGAIGYAIAIAGLLRARHAPTRLSALVCWATPLVLFNGLVLIASLNPSMKVVTFDAEPLFAVTGGRPGWPSSARPDLARSALLEFDTLWVACFNLVLVVKRRRLIRLLLWILVVNTALLSVFGTVQKLLGAPGLYFGAVDSPQLYFFSTFVYHNHWGAFAILSLAVLLGLGRELVRRYRGRDAFHSPITMVAFSALVIVATIPLSGSRSSTVLAALLLGGTLLAWMLRIIRKRQHFNESIAPVVILSILVVALSVAGIWYLGRDMIDRRLEQTRDQVAVIRAGGMADARGILYRDTWTMAKDKRWFGWGMASYPYVFTTYNTRRSFDGPPVYYHDAHNDWLQALAEHGIIGSMLLLSAVLLPLSFLRRLGPFTPLTTYSLAGCALIALYALVEFPFGNYAVVLTWWLCFFAAVHYANLSRATIEESEAALDQDKTQPRLSSRSNATA